MKYYVVTTFRTATVTADPVYSQYTDKNKALVGFFSKVGTNIADSSVVFFTTTLTDEFHNPIEKYHWEEETAEA